MINVGSRSDFINLKNLSPPSEDPQSRPSVSGDSPTVSDDRTRISSNYRFVEKNNANIPSGKIIL